MSNETDIHDVMAAQSAPEHESALALQNARAVADAVMYEGYLLYPYRASAAKNQIRWQFGVLGPQGAAANGVGEESALESEILVRRLPGDGGEPDGQAKATVTIRVRFLQLQSRDVESLDADGGFTRVDELQVDDERLLPWDEAIEQEVVVATVTLDEDELDQSYAVSVEGGHGETTEVRDQSGTLAGRLVRTRLPLSAGVHVSARAVDGGAADGAGVSRLQIRVENRATLPAPVRDQALELSFLGAHLLLTCESGEFVSLLDPPAELQSAVSECHQHRCWPVLAGPAGSSGVLLVSPIILEDHVSLAQESAGSLFDSTEIDEILTLRILTMTDDEKAQARATDPRAAEIIDRSESLTADEMARLHGALRNPHGLEDPMSTWGASPFLDLGDGVPGHGAPGNGAVPHPAADPGSELPSVPAVPAVADVPWWDPEQDESVDPGTDSVIVAGREVSRGSLVRLHPGRRADAQDLFFADQIARVTGVHFDVDGATHVGVVMVDDPAADLHDWYGRYMYFDPDELEPLDPAAGETDVRREAGQ
jgi:hypothetical protein